MHKIIICFSNFDENVKPFVDHNHKCCPNPNKTCGLCIRGLLCYSCNYGLGQFKDSVSNLLNAASYLNSTDNKNKK